MLRSFYSGISGLRNFQTKLDVVSNNISNVNTVGFKSSRVMFQDIMSQTLQGATAPAAPRGGVNPKQVGLGATISSIDTKFMNGSPQTTNYPTDFFIDGDGFFLVTGDGGNVKYLTRAGNFKLDANGDLVDTRGMKVVGVVIEYDNTTKKFTPVDSDNNGIPDTTVPNNNYSAINLKYVPFGAFLSDGSLANSQTGYGNPAPTPSDYKGINQVLGYGDGTGSIVPIEIVDYSIGSDGTIEVLGSDGNKYILPYKIAMAVVQNPEGLLKVGNSLYQYTGNADIGDLEDHITTPNNPETGSGAIYSGFLEMSNVDLSEEFTEMIIAQRGFQANSRIITTSDEVLQELVNLKR
jgi:flagellar hook protein FlgE